VSAIQNPESKTRNPLTLRLLSAALGIPLLLILCHLGGLPFSLALLVLSYLGLRELLQAYRRVGIRPNPILAAAGLLSPAWPLLAGPSAISLATARLYAHLPAVLVIVAALALFLEAWNCARHGMLMMSRSASYGLLCGIYVALFGGLGALREGYAYTADGSRFELGALLTFLTLFCVWATDSFAFFVGKKWGKRKLAPSVSPNKTVEGALGGLAAALVVGALFGQILLGKPVAGLLIGAIAGIFGQLGDLFESALKRNIGVKDLGGIIPGHGGILDRFDSLLFAAPLVALLAPWLLSL